MLIKLTVYEGLPIVVNTDQITYIADDSVHNARGAGCNSVIGFAGTDDNYIRVRETLTDILKMMSQGMEE